MRIMQRYVTGPQAMSESDWSDLTRRLSDVETRNAVDDVHRSNVGQRLSAIEDTLRWLVRLIIGGMLIAMLTYAMQGGLTALR